MIRRTILKNCMIITQNDKRDIFPEGDILIEDGIIKTIGKIDDDYADTIDLGGNIALPSFINCHLHLGETVFRGEADNHDLFGYLDISHDSYLNPVWERKKADIHMACSKIALLESIHHGVGTIACSRGWDQIRESGINGYPAYPLVRIKKLNDYYKNFDGGIDRYISDKNDRIETTVFIQGLLNINEKMLSVVSRKLSENSNLKLFIHISETKQELELVKRHYNLTPVKVLDKYNLLGPNTFCIHCVYLDDEEISLLKESQTNIVLCPTANLKLKSGVPEISKLFEKGLKICLATDGLATNNSASLLEVAKFAGLVSQGHNLKPQDLLDMITINPASALGTFCKKGSIEVGKDADIAVFTNYHSSICPRKNIISNLIYNCSGFRCISLFIRGRPIMLDNEVLTMNEKEVCVQFERLISILSGNTTWT